MGIVSRRSVNPFSFRVTGKNKQIIIIYSPGRCDSKLASLPLFGRHDSRTAATQCKHPEKSSLFCGVLLYTYFMRLNWKAKRQENEQATDTLHRCQGLSLGR